jgi:iron complex outermembrane receptor protein
VAPVGVGFLGPLPISLLLAGQPNPPAFNQTGRRPGAVNNWFDVPALERNMGHSLTATWKVNDQLTVKSMTSYRDVMAYSTYEYSGLGGLVTTPFISGFLTHKAVGTPYEVFALNNIVFNRQYSEEVQANYNSKLVTVTAGAIYYHLETLSGPPAGIPGNTINTSFPGGVQPLVVPPTDQSSNKTTSKAAYVQGEFHILPQLDFVAGDRITVDDKSGTLFNPAPCPCSFVYHGTRPSYTLGFNYKPARDALLYVKYSTGYVSGGSVSVFSFKPETAKSWELGAKADFLEHRVRTNLALFDVDYTDLQSPQGGPTVGHPELSTVVIDLGTARVKGVEFEGSVLPMKGLTLSGSFGYAAYKLSSLTPLAATIFAPGCPQAPLSCYQNVGLPSWTAMLSGDYVTDPVFGDARLHLTIDGTFHSNYRTVQNFQLVNSSFNLLQFIPDTWLLNARFALEHIAVENGQVTVALWGKNLTNEDSIQFPNTIPLFASTSFLPARTFGIDVNFKY